jgi:hypothetical protein
MSVDNSAANAADATIETTQTDAAPTGAIAASEAPAAQTGTLLGSEPTDKPVAAPADWPADWRQKIAGDDAKELARLQRLGNSPADVYKAYRALEAKLSSGQAKPALPDNPTPEQLTEWRKANGIPEAPDGYEPALPDGMVLGEADKPLVTDFQRVALDANMTTQQFNKTLEWYHKHVDNFRAQQEEADTASRREVEDTLRSEWGNEYRGNINAVNNTMRMYFGDAAAEILSARTPSGKMVGDFPEFIKGMALTAKELNPAMGLIPAGSSNPLQATESRISEIEAMMKAPNAGDIYWRNEKVQAEYLQLIEAREKYAGRSAA